MRKTAISAVFGLACLLLADAVSAQSVLQSSRSFNGLTGGDDVFTAAAAAPGGGFYLAGYSSYAPTGYDIWLAKVDASLNLVASTTVNGSGNDFDAAYGVAVSSSGMVYVVGATSVAAFGMKPWIGVFDASLGVIFSTNYAVGAAPASDTNASFDAIVIEPDGNLLVVGDGYPYQGAAWSHILLTRYNTGLTVLASTTFNNGFASEYGDALLRTAAGDIFVGGGIAPAALTSHDAWIGKFNTSLALQTSDSFAGAAGQSDSIRGITMGATGDLYVAGAAINSGVTADVWLARYTTNLVRVSSRSIAGVAATSEHAGDIATGSPGTLIIGGSLSQTGQNQNLLLAEIYESDLTTKSTGTVTSAGSNNDIGYAVVVDTAAGSALLAGFITGTGLDGWVGLFSVSVTSVPGPSAPSGFAGTALSSNSISWSWTDNASNETGYRVLSGTISISGDLAANTTSWSQGSLGANTSYGPYAAQAFNSTGTADSSTASRYTLASVPTGLAASGVTSSVATITWSGAGTTYQLERSTGTGFVVLQTSSATSRVDTGLALASTYYYRVAALNGDAVASAYASSITVVTSPAAPTLVSIAVSPTSQTLIPGGTQQLTATGTFSDSSTGSVTGLVWSSSSPAVASVNASGVVTALSTGTAVIHASSGAFVGSSTMTVVTLVVGPSPVVVTAVAPSSGTTATSPAVSVTGTRFVSTTTFALERINGAGSWAGATAMPTSRDSGKAERLNDGRVMVVGGINNVSASVILSSATLYDPSLNAWSAAAGLSVTRHGHILAKLDDGRLLVAGGNSTGSLYHASSEIYDPATGLWTSAGSLSRARSSAASVKLPDGRVLVAGGYDGASRTDVDLYDPTTGSWTARAPLNVARSGPTFTVLRDGRVLATGGIGVGVNLTSAEIYDPIANSWTTVSSMTVERYSHRAALLPDGRVLVLGGAGTGVIYSSTELYDPVANTWTAGPGMSVPRYMPNIEWLGGRLLAIGGMTVATVGTTSVEAYDPGLNTWTTLGSLATARFQAASSVLEDGRVLIAGGHGGGTTALSQAELYSAAVASIAATGVLAPTSFTLTGTLPLSGAATGYWDLVARGPGVARLNGGFRVLAAALNSLAVSPSSAALQVGDQQVLSAVASFTDGSTWNYTSVALWTSSPTSVATVSSSGVVTAVSSGTAVITASSGAFTSSSVVTVTAFPAPTGFAGTAVSTSALLWSWTDNASTELGYRVMSGTVNLSGDLAANTTTWLQIGLASSTLYGPYYARAFKSGAASDSSASSQTTSAIPPAPTAPTSFSGAALSPTAILWTWLDNASTETGYRVMSGSVNYSGDLSVSAASWTQTGLTPDTSYGPYFARVFNIGGASDSSSGTRRTLAAAPVSTAVSSFTATVTTIAWSANGNPATTTAEVHRSTDNAAFSLFYTSAATFMRDASLLGCTSYYYKVRHVNGDAVSTAFDSTVLVRTADTVPAPPASLSAEAVAGGRVALGWVGSPTEGVTGYRLFSDGGTGVFNFGSPLAVFTSTETTYTTGVLTSSAAYSFVLRAAHRCGTVDTVGVSAAAASTTTLASVRAAIKNPDSGKRINGNSVTIMAELMAGTPSDVSQVRFQFRASTTAAWADIPAANVNHPNPDLQAPYFTHWNVGIIAAGSYQLRAVARDLSGNDDPAPGAISVTVTAVAPDITENIVGGDIQKSQALNNAVTNTVATGGADANDPLTKVVLPPNALNSSTVTVTVEANPTITTAPPSGFTAVGSYLRIDLDNGQHDLSNGQTACITMSYPSSGVDPSRLNIYSYDNASSRWTKDFNSTVNTSSRTITGCTPHFSIFAVFAGVATTTMLDSVRVYPNPYKPNSGDPDTGKAFTAGDATTGIIFDNLPAIVVIEIYSLTGRKVARFDTTASGGLIRWDSRNTDGRDVASGGYFAVISSPGLKSTVKKLLIIR